MLFTYENRDERSLLLIQVCSLVLLLLGFITFRKAKEMVQSMLAGLIHALRSGDKIIFSLHIVVKLCLKSTFLSLTVTGQSSNTQFTCILAYQKQTINRISLLKGDFKPAVSEACFRISNGPARRILA